MKRALEREKHHFAKLSGNIFLFSPQNKNNPKREIENCDIETTMFMNTWLCSCQVLDKKIGLGLEQKALTFSISMLSS